MTFSVSSVHRFCGILVLCTAILLTASPGLGQQGEDSYSSQPVEVDPAESARFNPFGLESKVARVASPELAGMALDAPVDPDKYILGPGDVLGISFRGGIGMLEAAEITPEGNLLIPQLPMLQVGGQSLTATREMIASSWSEELEGIPIEITLLAMRRMRVSIGGAVSHPGQYIVTPADRALTLIKLAGDVLDEASQRNAVLVHADGTRERVDPLRYLRFGSRDANPLLTAGSHMIVYPKPSAEELAVIEVSGAVVMPGVFEWIPGDHLMDAVELAGGLRADTDVEIELTHFQAEQPSTEIIRLSELDDSRGPRLQSGDLVFVPLTAAQRFSRATVVVKGEVGRPGQYPIIAHETSLLDVLEMAGGITEHGSLRGSRIWHKQSKEDQLAQEVERLDSLHYLLITRSEINFIRDYRRSKERDYLPIDFEGLFGDDEDVVNTNNIALFDSLVINVPRNVHHVLVLGAVEKPGYYEYNGDWKYKDYVKLAGGYLKEADKRNTRLLPFESAQFILARNNVKIQSGDTIYVPEKWLQSFWATFRSYFSVFLQAATLTILIVTTF